MNLSERSDNLICAYQVRVVGSFRQSVRHGAVTLLRAQTEGSAIYPQSSRRQALAGKLGMDPPRPGVDRLVISCRAYGVVEMLDLQQGVMTPERLSIRSTPRRRLRMCPPNQDTCATP